METAAVPSVYCNIASVTASFNEIRLYLAEAAPMQVSVDPVPGATPKPTEANVMPRLCIVVNPEFSRASAMLCPQRLSNTRKDSAS